MMLFVDVIVVAIDRLLTGFKVNAHLLFDGGND
jgi:hypothetical protein